ncbi:MAG: NAD-dependent epimerase/dehydratase family protein [Armatimonadetes bacterium]|nr:NAD-dependent epimerase/dehydratase family protein [Armatimonadota bacterium]
MKVLFIGGTGIISSGCAPLALDRGIDLYFLNRGKSTRDTPEDAKQIFGDVRDPKSMEEALANMTFDVVVNWIAFTPDHIRQDIEMFAGKVSQYVFISSASAYQTPPSTLPVTESTILDNPFWEYSRNKIACEEMLVEAYRNMKFPITIVRPSHTYDQRLLPFDHGWTVVGRMRKGKPVVVHGDGTSLWVLTHHKDFAKGFVPLLGNSHAIGEAYHITSDELLNWNQIYDIVAAAAGTTARKVHIASETLAAHDPNWGPGLLGDKANSMIFDNTKIKRTAPDFVCTYPFARGAEEIIGWYDADPARQVINAEKDALQDKLVELFG